MDNLFQNAKWIWCNSNPQKNEYGEFVDHFSYESGNVILRISADSNYATYINGELAAWGQYADFPYDKIYDEVDITKYCRQGENRIATLVWYHGLETTQTYYPGNAAVLYEVECNNAIICESNENTLSRMSKGYIHHGTQTLTPQLGYTFSYDATKEDNWMTGDLVDFTPSSIVNQNLPLRIRPCNMLTLLPDVDGVEYKRISDTDVIFDLGGEQVGFLSFKLTSPCEQDLVISYGEHLVDGCVRQIIGPRDFSVNYRAKEGENVFMQPFRRLGGQFLEVHSETPLVIEKMAIAPTMYVLEEKERPALTEKQNKIYDMCVETLHLCMHEHYEDCPWREQALYAMDSRNQMLCGYYAFGEYTFPRSSLELMSKDNRKDGLLSITFPITLDLVIPSFSLHYITECREYMEYSGDTAFLAEIYPKLVSVIETFTKRITDGLVPPFPGKTYWNFYEWKDGLSGGGPGSETYDFNTPDLLLNSLLSIALQNLSVIANKLGIENTYDKQAEILNARIYEVFWDKDAGICYDFRGHKSYSQLGNSLAILCGALTGNEAKAVCERMLTDTEMTPVTLSMKCFKYDAWLKVDKEHYTPIILEDIETVYTPMLEFGGTTVWETELGESDFDDAGSLCHGWSAMPIYYYHTLL